MDKSINYLKFPSNTLCFPSYLTNEDKFINVQLLKKPKIINDYERK